MRDSDFLFHVPKGPVPTHPSTMGRRWRLGGYGCPMRHGRPPPARHQTAPVSGWPSRYRRVTRERARVEAIAHAAGVSRQGPGPEDGRSNYTVQPPAFPSRPPPLPFVLPRPRPRGVGYTGLPHSCLPHLYRTSTLVSSSVPLGASRPSVAPVGAPLPSTSEGRHNPHSPSSVRGRRRTERP